MTLPVTAVLGVGLIGGSLARRLARAGLRILAYDSDPAAVEALVRDQVAQVALGADLAGLEEAGLVVLGVPVSDAPSLLAAALPRLHGARLVTDVGSTKRGIVAAAERLGIGAHFVGSHPLAGSEKSGWTSTQANLFKDRRVFLCPAQDAGDEATALARDLWKAVGASPEVVSPEAHDELLAWISHLPQVVSTALGLALTGHGLLRRDLGQGGQDMTRLADSSPAMWRGILLENRDEILPALRSFRKRLSDLEMGLQAGDGRAIEDFMAAGRAWFQE